MPTRNHCTPYSGPSIQFQRQHETQAYLCLGVRASPKNFSAASQLSDLGVELMGQNDGQGHGLLRLVRGVAEHEALVTGPNVVIVTIDVYSLRNVGTLLLQGNQNIARLEVETCESKVSTKDLYTILMHPPHDKKHSTI